MNEGGFTAAIHRYVDPGETLGEVLFVLLFIVGCLWAHYTEARPLGVGAIVTLLGLSLVVVAVLLGG